MLPRRPHSIVALALVALLLPVDARAAKARSKNSLLTVAEPLHGNPARAHPFINVVVHFGRLADLTPADPATFRAKMGREDITGLFTPILDVSGNRVGMRARLEANRIKLGRRPRNIIRFSVQAARVPGQRRARDLDRVRFSAVEVPNQTCSATAGADQEIIVPGFPVAFTGSKNTSDPDSDELTYLWDFGDGTTSTDPDPQHTYEQHAGEVTATLTVSDTQDTCSATVVMKAVPALDPGKTAGTIFVDSDGPMAFGAVAPGASGTKTLRLRNDDVSETSQVRLRMATTTAAFQLSETAVITLGPGESREVGVTFAPQAAGHQQTRFSLVASAANRQALSFIGHGFGGTAPDDGPTGAVDPLFFMEPVPGLLGVGTFGYMPDGRRFFVDTGVHTCVVPGNGSGTGDVCISDQNCAANGGTCGTSSTCLSGANTGQPCTTPADCPGSVCPSSILFDPVDLCSDGRNIFLVSEEGSFTEPDPNAETDRTVTLMRMDLDDTGAVIGREILGRLNTETAHLACDAFPASQGGQLFVPEFHEVPDQGSCFRSEREALVRIAKGNGSTQVITGRIDAYAGVLECDDLDPVQQLEVTRDGSRLLAAFESGGLWQIRPSLIFYSADITDAFQVHPDGSALFAAAIDSGSNGLVNVYRITPDQVQSGPLPFSALVPCASFAVPNNGSRSMVVSFAAARSAVGSQDAVGLVSFVSAAQGVSDALSPSLIVRGTVAFSIPANTTECSVQSLVNLEPLDMRF